MAIFNQEQTEAYDARVRRLFGAFDEMHALAAAEVALDEPQKILCLGAGKGDEIGHIQRLLPDAQFTAVDPSPDMPIEGKVRFPNAEWITGDINQAPAGPFDAATFHLVVHFLADEDNGAAFKGLHQRLKPSARLIVTGVVQDGMPETWDVWEREVRIRILVERIPITRENFQAHCTFRPIGWYEQSLAEAGFINFRLFFRYGLFAGFTVQMPPA